jgi:hypothetical protein
MGLFAGSWQWAYTSDNLLELSEATARSFPTWFAVKTPKKALEDRILGAIVASHEVHPDIESTDQQYFNIKYWICRLHRKYLLAGLYQADEYPVGYLLELPKLQRDADALVSIGRMCRSDVYRSPL